MEIQHAQELSKELKNLVDANGKVKKGYEGRVEYILGELNSAAGTEYKIIDGTIEKYKELMLIRSKNTMIEAVKDELNKEITNFEKLNDYTFDPNDGYLACELLDGKIRASSPKNIVISYDYEGMVDKLSNHFDKLNDFYNEKTGSFKKIAFITTSKWNELKLEYINLHKQGKHFEYQEEPVLNTLEEDDKINSESNDLISKTIEMFGDLVEVE